MNETEIKAPALDEIEESSSESDLIFYNHTLILDQSHTDSGPDYRRGGYANKEDTVNLKSADCQR